ncbi:unnamed protein product [Hyaloperonospora brassicae]|uniref:RxLR effector candidate protein n=1 Tax=Hyaloperonospora brassicae TaxID=162125 RepID=A0AAV0UIA8_HYABA|nr:unnamed protein product [Hyaloperonospora brassicae]
MSNGTARSQLVIEFNVEDPLPVLLRLINALHLRSKTRLTEAVATIGHRDSRAQRAHSRPALIKMPRLRFRALATGCALSSPVRAVGSRSFERRMARHHVVSPVAATRLAVAFQGDEIRCCGQVRHVDDPISAAVLVAVGAVASRRVCREDQ